MEEEQGTLGTVVAMGEVISDGDCARTAGGLQKAKIGIKKKAAAKDAKAKASSAQAPAWMRILEDRGVAMATANRRRAEVLEDLHGGETPETVHKGRQVGAKMVEQGPVGEPGACTPVVPRAIDYDDDPQRSAENMDPTHARPLERPAGSSAASPAAFSECSTLHRSATNSPALSVDDCCFSEEEVDLEAKKSDHGAVSPSPGEPTLSDAASTPLSCSASTDAEESDEHPRVQDVEIEGCMANAVPAPSTTACAVDTASDVMISHMTINGLCLDGIQGLSEQVRGDLNLFIQNMQKHSANLAIQAQSCIFLRNLCQVDERSKAKLGQCGVLAHILKVMIKHKDVLLSELACWCLSTACTVKTNAIAAIRENAHQKIASTMSEFPKSQGVQEQGCWLLFVLIFHGDPMLERIRASKSVLRCVQAARKTHAGTRVVEYANKCLHSMRQTQEVTTISSSQRWKRFFEHMSEHQQNADALLQDCRYLYNEGSKGLLLCSNGILMKKLGETLVSVLLGSIVANKSNAQVVEICLALFGIFGGNEDFCAFVSRSTSVREIISLMDHHPGNRDVQKNACFALHKLAVSPDLSSQIQAQDGVSKVFGVMDVFQQDADVQIVGCLAIRNMSSNLTNLAHTLSSAFNIERLINVMRFHGYSGDAVVAACTALGHLSANCKESSLDACRQGGVAALQQVMQIHGDCHTVQLAALTCLRTLSTAANNQSTIAEKSVFVTVMKSMTRHMNSKHLVSEACRFLANAGRQGNTILDAITDANCLEILLAALGFYSAYPDVEELMVTALYSLAYRSPDCQTRIIAIGGVEKLRGVVNKSTALPNTRQWGQILLNHLTVRSTTEPSCEPNSSKTCESSNFIAVSVGFEKEVSNGGEVRVDLTGTGTRRTVPQVRPLMGDTPLFQREVKPGSSDPESNVLSRPAPIVSDRALETDHLARSEDGQTENHAPSRRRALVEVDMGRALI